MIETIITTAEPSAKSKFHDKLQRHVAVARRELQLCEAALNLTGDPQWWKRVLVFGPLKVMTDADMAATARALGQEYYSYQGAIYLAANGLDLDLSLDDLC